MTFPQIPVSVVCPRGPPPPGISLKDRILRTGCASAGARPANAGARESPPGTLPADLRAATG